VGAVAEGPQEGLLLEHLPGLRHVAPAARALPQEQEGDEAGQRQDTQGVGRAHEPGAAAVPPAAAAAVGALGLGGGGGGGGKGGELGAMVSDRQRVGRSMTFTRGGTSALPMLARPPRPHAHMHAPGRGACP
jgi:hypothetical protein